MSVVTSVREEVSRRVVELSRCRSGEIHLPGWVTVQLHCDYEEEVNDIISIGPLRAEYRGRLVCIRDNGEVIFEINS